MFLDEFIENFKSTKKPKGALSFWQPYSWQDTSSHPLICYKYLVCKKDGKIHWETWNGNGWAYNQKEIRYWAEILKP
jgi:hypothetical protein